MSADQDRQEIYDRLRERFLVDPDFRVQLRENAEATLESELGSLTEDERQWITGLSMTFTSDAELVEQVRSSQLGAW